MSNPAQLSPMVIAIDLVRVNVNAMQLDDLQDHAAQVLDTIGALNDYINSPAPKSANALRNAMTLLRKLAMHMAHVRDLINAHTAAAALVGAAQATGAASLPQGAKPFGP
jgi:ABC-type transporter Mla subunit MlaD